MLSTEEDAIAVDYSNLIAAVSSCAKKNRLLPPNVEHMMRRAHTLIMSLFIDKERDRLELTNEVNRLLDIVVSSEPPDGASADDEEQEILDQLRAIYNDVDVFLSAA